MGTELMNFVNELKKKPEESWNETKDFKEEFTVLKSGEFKGCVSTKWHRNNCGWIGIKCPKCGNWIQNYKGCYEELCKCGWEKNRSGFRYRYILQDKIEMRSI